MSIREWDRDDNVVEDEAFIFQFILDIDVACAVIGRRGPAIDYLILISVGVPKKVGSRT